MPEYHIIHEVTETAESEAEARQAYVESWRDGFYSKDDIDVKEEDKSS